MLAHGGVWARTTTIPDEFLEQNSGLFDAAFAGMYAMMVFLAIPSLIAMLNTLAIGVIERRREIGMLRAVGATRRHVGSLVVAEALILAAIIPARQAARLDIVQALRYE